MPDHTKCASFRPSCAGRIPNRSRIELLCLMSGSLPSELGVLFGKLIAPITGENQGIPTLRPFWAEEAMHRSYAILRLLHARLRQEGPGGMNPDAWRADCNLADDLARLFRSAEMGDAHRLVPCSAMLRNLILDIEALFAVAAGDVIFRTEIQRLTLPAYKRRALVLAVTELSFNALLHGFRGRSGGEVAITVRSVDPDNAVLSVADNGRGFAGSDPNFSCGVAGGMATLLDATLEYSRKEAWTKARIVIPLA